MKTILKYIIINRLFLILMALACTLLIPLLKNQVHRGNASFDIYQGDHAYSYTEPRNILIGMWSVWDSKWYISIAEDGYSKQRTPYERIDNKGFMPAYPFLMWLFANTFFFGNYFLAGIFVSNIFLILSLYILDKFIKSEEELKNKVDIKTVYLFLLFFPTSYFLSSIYPESLFLFLSIFSLYLLNKKQIIWAGVIIGIASITKIFGIFLLIPLLGYIIRNKKDLNIKKICLTLISLSFIPIIYLTHMYIISGDIFAYKHIQELYFGHKWIEPFTKIIRDVFFVHKPQELLHGIATLFGMIVIILGIKHVKIEYSLFGLLYILFAPITGMTNGNARYVSGLFLIPIILSILIKKEEDKIIYVSIISFIQGFIFIWWIVGAGFTS